jgi:hydrogenase nickel incorporation protein HypA/HybF
MHELPVTQNLLELALHHAENAGASRILKLNITIGALASIIDDSVQFYWDMISKDTIAEGAELHFNRIPIQMQCLNCASTYQPHDGISACPECNSNQVRVIAGQEFYLDSIDIEK